MNTIPDHNTSHTRLFLVPLGLVVLGFVLSFITARNNSRLPTARSGVHEARHHVAARQVQAVWRGVEVRHWSKGGVATASAAAAAEAAADASAETSDADSSAVFLSYMTTPSPPSQEMDDEDDINNIQNGGNEHVGDTELALSRDSFPSRVENSATNSANDDGVRVKEEDDEKDDNREEESPGLVTAVAGELAKLAMVVLVAAVFFKLYPGERRGSNGDLTWIDALYFAVVTSTTVGYGDISPASDGGRVFMTVYMLVSTVVVGGILGSLIDIYVNGYVGEQIMDTLIDSTIWVHKADLDGDGCITEADYILFKLQQMQKVDANMLDRLIDKYRSLDRSESGDLQIGVEVPSATQVGALQMKQERIRNQRGQQPELMHLWLEYQERFDLI